MRRPVLGLGRIRKKKNDSDVDSPVPRGNDPLPQPLEVLGIQARKVRARIAVVALPGTGALIERWIRIQVPRPEAKEVVMVPGQEIEIGLVIERRILLRRIVAQVAPG